MTKIFEKNLPCNEKNWFKKFLYYFNPKKEQIVALNNVNIHIKEGEFIGLVGPNGSGKTTLVKILSGILTPNSGKAVCLGKVPYDEREDYVKNIGVMFGARSILEYNIPVIDSLKLYSIIYDLTEQESEERINYLSELLDIKDLLHTPVRKLSLGQKMRCNFVASFLHKPKIVFLDEPTIGLDALVREKVHEFLSIINKKEKVTILLTTHNMDDIEELCKKIILINKGKIMYDGELKKFKEKHITTKSIFVTFSKIKNRPLYKQILKNVVVKKSNKFYFEGEVNVNNSQDIINDLFNSLEITDLNVQESELEEIIKDIYKSFKEAKT